MSENIHNGPYDGHDDLPLTPEEQARIDALLEPLMPAPPEPVDLGEPTSLWNFDREGDALGYGNPNWLVPGFLEPKNRVLFTGPSGRGKSTMIRQIGLCAAGGVMPWDAPGQTREFEPVNVTMIDCENNKRQTWKGMRSLIDRMRNQYGDKITARAGRNFHLKVREDGLDLLNPANVEAVLALLGKTVPGILILGPLYMLNYGDGNSESVAFEVARAIRTILNETGAALITEAHAAKTPSTEKPKKEPMGSSIWVRWPDMGRCLFPTDDDVNLFQLAEFRGDRELRSEIPEYVRKDWGSRGYPCQMLPWRAETPDGELL